MAQQILGSDKIARFNDSPLLGLGQSIDWNSSLNGQDAFELGKTSKVGTSYELETSGTLEFASSGGLADLLSRMIVRRSAGAFQGFKYDEVVVGATASAGTTTTLTTTGLTASAHVGQKLIVTAGTGAGYVGTITGNTTTVITVSPANGVAFDATSVFRVIRGNAQTFTEADLVDTVFNLIIHEKADNLTYNRSVVLPRCFPTSISGRYDANGNATESLGFQGDFAVGAPSPYHEVRVVPCTRASATTATLVPYDGAAILSAAWTVMYFYVDEKRIRNTTSGDAINANISGSNTITITGSYTIPTTATLFAVLYKNTAPSATFPSLSAGDRATSLTTVRGNQVDIFIAPATLGSETDSERWLRCQSFDFNVDFRNEALRQIAYNDAGTSVYARLPTLPFTITANFSAFEDQWADWRAMLNKSFPGNAVYQDTYDFAPASLKNQFAVVVKTYTASKQLVQTLRFTDMRLESHGRRVQAGGRSEMTWALQGTAFYVSGANL